MLDNDQTKSARPRPPAQRRRQSTTPATVKKGGASPPPPYSGAGFSFPAESPSSPPRRRLESLLGSPVSATLKALGWDLDADPTNAAAPHPDWLTAESRDELADLLVKADGLIKERQNELGLTVSTLKNLYDNNAAIKTQHRALLARIPASPTPSPGPDSRPASPWFADKLPRAMSDVFARGPMRHTRKISVSQSDLSYLSEQNAELLDKLAKLEAESSQADQKGRRTLQRLEEEIAQLRGELDQAQARSVELEEQARTSPPRETVDERKDRIMAARKMSSAQQDPDWVEDEVKDFAPGGALCSTTSFTTPKKQSRAEEEDHTEEHVRSPSTQSLISQLLAKIQELEETNQHIVAQQHDTNSRLQTVQKETENISRLYECLNDSNNVQLELIEEGSVEQPTAQKATSAKDTIRFQSFRRTLEQDVANRLSAESTLPSQVTKTRKSVMGLFDSPSTSRAASRLQPDISSLRLPTTSFDRRNHTTSFSADTSASYSRPASPALSVLSLASHGGHGPQPSFSQVFSQLPTPSAEQPTLQAELGNEALDGQWGLHGESHLRRSSLYSFSSMSMPPSPSPMPGSSLAFPSITRSRSPSPSPTRASPRTPMRQPMFSLEPPTPETPGTANGERLETPQAQRYRRMSQTVRARTTRWVEGRFRDSLIGEAPPGRKDLAEALEAMAEGTLTPAPASPAMRAAPVPEEDERVEAPSTAVERSPPKGVANSKQKRVVNLVVEAWLWLQFLLIIFVFVWAMAKRGPKAVLREAERKRRAAA